MRNADRSIVFKALGHPWRLAFVRRLVDCGRSCTVGEMQECCPVDLSGVSRHLVLLRNAGIVKAERRGKEVYYSLVKEALVPELRRLAISIEKCCVKCNDKKEKKR